MTDAPTACKDALIEQDERTGRLFMASQHITTSFWGIPDKAGFSSDLTGLIERGFGSTENTFAGDNLVAIQRNLSFLSDSSFMTAFGKTITPENEPGQGIIWRLNVLCWAARVCLKREGDFVECGVSTGTSSRVMCDYLDFGNIDKKLWLYDVFGATPSFDTRIYFGETASVVPEVRARFSDCPNVEIMPGFIPNSFSDGLPDKVAFLHIDLNNVAAEIASLETLFDRVSPGGIILFDDYGFAGFRNQKQAEDDWLAARDHFVLELPTGQGLVIKS